MPAETTAKRHLSKPKDPCVESKFEVDRNYGDCLPDSCPVSLANAAYTGNSRDLEPEDTDANHHNIFWHPEGTRLYQCSQNELNQQAIIQHNAATPWDVTSLDSPGTKTFYLTGDHGGPAQPKDVYFLPDGLTMITLHDDASKAVTVWTLGTAWEIDTLGVTPVINYIELVTAQNLGWVESFWIKSDGTRFWVLDSSFDYVWEFDLGTAWDFSTMAYNGVRLDIRIAAIGSPESIRLSKDGLNLYISQRFDASTYLVNRFSLTTAFSMAAGTLEADQISAPNVAPYNTYSQFPRGIFIRDDGVPNCSLYWQVLYQTATSYICAVHDYSLTG